jgi:hypothetical protein
MFSIKAIFFSRPQRLICFSLLKATLHILMAFVIHRAMAVVFLGEALNRIVFMLMNSTREKARDTNIERAGPAE